MKKTALLILTILFCTVLFTSCTSKKKSFSDLNEMEKSVFLSVDYHMRSDKKSEYVLVGNPWYAKDTNGKTYEFATVITWSGKEETWMFCNEYFVEDASFEIPNKEIISGSITNQRAKELIEIINCKAVYETILIFGEVKNKYVSSDVTIDFTEQVDGLTIARICGMKYQEK